MASRPLLSTIWLDAAPGPEGWPAEADGDVLALRAAASHPPEWAGDARRPGTQPWTAVLDPHDDTDFALALALAPFSGAVETMSRDGQLVCTRGRADGSLRLRLSDVEHAEVLRAVPDGERWLVRVERPAGLGGRRSRRTVTIPSAVAGIVLGLSVCADGSARLPGDSSFWATFRDAAMTLLGMSLALVSLKDLGSAARRTHGRWMHGR